MIEFLGLAFGRALEAYSSQIPIMLGLAALFTVLTVFESQTSSPGKVWWRNPEMPTDITYALIHSLIGPYLRMAVIFFFAGLMVFFIKPESIGDLFKGQFGPLSGLSFWWQALIYVLLADFMMYWIHRLFHSNRLWRFHAIHHSPTEVDWTATYRFHPVNLMMQPVLVGVIMMMLGISPEVIAFFVPFDILSAAFVHANVNWTFGPLKYIIATPVFHRWHHGPADDGGSSNFAPTFAFYDYIFGTFYMPEGRLPQNFGVDDHHFPRGYFAQLIYPFQSKNQPENATSAEPGAAAGVAG
jgi:sterol desaturase/sphingolipid hydroxylase (fatty acid hydroxylase superfamily)